MPTILAQRCSTGPPWGMKSQQPSDPSNDVPPAGEWYRHSNGCKVCLIAVPCGMPLGPTQLPSREPSQSDPVGLPLSVESVFPHPIQWMLVHARTLVASAGSIPLLLCNDPPGFRLVPGAAPRPNPTASRSAGSTSGARFSCHAASADRFLHRARTEHLSGLPAWAILPRHLQGTPCFHRLVVAGRWICVSRF